jgi:hypothetical protein
MQDMKQIRNAFSEWPSELEVAKEWGNWSTMACSFFCAAVVLDEELTSAGQAMYTEAGNQLRDDQLMRRQTYLPAVFCLAFSLELAVKKLGKLENITNHSICEIARSIDGFAIDAKTKEVLNWASSVIRDGKYPAPKKPSDTKSGGFVTVHFGELLDDVKPVYDRLMAL